MTTKRKPLFLAFGSLIAAGGLHAALAAQDAPESLLPPGFEQPTPEPTPAPSPRPTPTPTPTPTPAPVPRDTGPADSDADLSSDLDEDDEESLDTAADDENSEDVAGGFAGSSGSLSLTGEAPWGAVDGRFHKILMRRLDVPLASRWAHIGLRSALMSNAPAPGDLGAQDWLAERVWLLLRMGEADAARLMLAAGRVSTASPKLAQVILQTALAASDPAAMCPVPTRLDDAEPDAEPLVRAVCAALSAQPEIASDIIARARRGGTLDAIDLALVDKLIGAGSGTGRATTLEWEPVDRLNSWRYGLATGTGVLPPETLMDNVAPRVRAWAARAPLLSADARLPFARTAAGMGVFSGQALVDLYSLEYDRLPPEDLSGTDALLLRRTFAEPDRAERLAAMREFWALGDGEPHERMASLAATALAAVQVRPDAALEAEAPDLVAAMLTAGFVEQALRWNSVLDDMDDAAADGVWSQLVLAGARGEVSPRRVRAFVSRDDAEGKRRSAILVASLAGLGLLEDAQVADLDEDEGWGIMRETRLTQLLGAAASRGDQGTVMLLAAVALQADTVGAIPPAYWRALIGALDTVGQDFLARMIAAEAVARA